jgi:uncharacterized tellurite resistance protein B-like protein
MIGLFESKKTKRIKTHLKNLIVLALADGNISAEELEILKRVGKKVGLNEGEIKSLIGNPASLKIELPDNDAERFDQIYELVQMMMADGKIHDEEMEFCVDVATKLGFRKAIVGIVVRKIVVGLQESTPKDKIKDEAAVFLNFN